MGIHKMGKSFQDEYKQTIWNIMVHSHQSIIGHHRLLEGIIHK